ncbi:Insect cuticle protein,Chitin-binding type R&R consensus [Cinara cedri]|uniref:Insect cuticle protein,Chitin-binding type R&R consensus n=1 Tax=Cinara cedri TaxID=506608 RepID=A0A5E4MDY1_9HEMI|nr:Insect cuticle protein,Chitin-binding type R&R consensus [Cinara cedri]
MIVVPHIAAVCWFTLMSRSFVAANVPAGPYSWSAYQEPVSDEPFEVKQPWKQTSSPPQSSSFAEYDGANDDHESEVYPAQDYAPVKPYYTFAYGVDDPKTGHSHGHSETRDGSKVTGEYTVMEPDGVLRRVQYTADSKNGFRASVRYVRPDGETSRGQDHGYVGYHSDNNDDDDEDRSPGQHQQQQQHPSSDYESPADGDHDEPYPLPPPSPPKSLSSFDFGAFNSINNDDVGDYNDDDGGGGGGGSGGGGGPSMPFKFPSFNKVSGGVAATDTDSEDYGINDEGYKNWLDSPPTPYDDESPSSSPSPFGLPPSSSSFGLSPSSQSRFGVPSSQSSFNVPSPLAEASASASHNNDGPPTARPCVVRPFTGYPTGSTWKPPSYEMARSREGHFKGYGISSASPPLNDPESHAKGPDDEDDDAAVNDEHNAAPFGSLSTRDGDGPGFGVVQQHSAEDSDPDTAKMAGVQLLPSAGVQTPRPPSSSSPTPSLRSRPIVAAGPSSPAPFRRPSPTDVRLLPASTMTRIEPTIIDIGG